MKIKELKEQVAEMKQARLALANSWDNTPEVNAQEVEKFDAMSADIERIENEIKKLERVEIAKAASPKKEVSFSYDQIGRAHV